MLTPFGIEVRKQRLDKGMRLLDMADAMNKTAAFLSSVETGRKPIPDGFVDEAADALSASPEERAALVAAADRTRREVKVGNLAGQDRELVAAFARKLGNQEQLNPGDLDTLKKLILKSRQGEKPFRRRRGMLVKPLDTLKIWEYSEMVRSAFVPDDVIAFPIMDVLEFRLAEHFPGFYVDVCTAQELGDDEGQVIPGRNLIKLREDVYRRAWDGVGRDRFTACHEFAHYLMHREIPMSRMVPSTDYPIYRDAEWQADVFAGALLMSSRHARRFESPHDMADMCGVSDLAAEVQWANYRKKGKI